MTVDQMIEVLQAYKAGKKVQAYISCEWRDFAGSQWDFMSLRYRVKPEPKVIWVNEYAEGAHVAYDRKEDALFCNSHRNIRTAVRYVESEE